MNYYQFIRTNHIIDIRFKIYKRKNIISFVEFPDYVHTLKEL